MKLSAVSTVFLFLLNISIVVPQESPTHQDVPGVVATQSGGTARWEHDQLQKMQREQKALRHKQLQADTEKLLELATELKTSVGKTNEHVLSLDVVRKAEEIEKLAKHIKTNMRDEMR